MTISEDFNLAQMFQYIHVLPCLEMLNPPAIPTRKNSPPPCKPTPLQPKVRQTIRWTDMVIYRAAITAKYWLMANV